MNGLASADPEILKRLDKGLEEKGVSSNSIPVSINKSGGLSKTSSAVDENILNWFQAMSNIRYRKSDSVF